MTNGDASARVLIVDDHPMVREGMAMWISAQQDLGVCGEAASEDEVLALVKQANPDLMIVDLCLKSRHGIALIKQVKSRYPSVKMLVVSGFQESLYAERALRAGAMGYLNKQESNAKVFEAIRIVLKGERFVSPETARRLVTQALGSRDDTKDPIEHLSDRELEVFRMIGKGLASSVIANQLHHSTHTIDTHCEDVKRKLGVHNAAEPMNEPFNGRWRMVRVFSQRPGETPVP